MSGNSAIKANDIQPKNYPDPSDGLMAWSPTSNLVVLLPVGNMFKGGNTSLQTANLVVTMNTTPINSVQNTRFGQMWTDGTYLYVGTANNVIKRVALSPF